MGISSSLGTYESIWEMVKQIPKGKVATYGQIAAESGFPHQSRMAGYALHALPPHSGVPWHRVINARGRISFPEKSESYNRQKRLLRKEGVIFVRGVIDLERFGWLSDTASAKE